jgi:predicted regulator of Ras-like GTPase activity (Roadblock/LC7/MglB family)
MNESSGESSLARVLEELLSIPTVHDALVLTRQGEVLASASLESASLAAACRSILSAAARATGPRDDLVRVDLRRSRGSTVLLPAGRDAFLAVRTSTRTPESLSLELSRAAAAIRRRVG